MKQEQEEPEMTDSDAPQRDQEAVVARQAQVMDQLPPTPGTPRATFAPAAVTPPAWWAEARIPLDGPETAGS